jgi:ATP-dependent DNA ligase
MRALRNEIGPFGVGLPTLGLKPDIVAGLVRNLVRDAIEDHGNEDQRQECPEVHFALLASQGDIVFRHACKMGLEGIVSKRLGSRYRSGRSPDWLKFKNPDAPAVRREAEEDWRR